MLPLLVLASRMARKKRHACLGMNEFVFWDPIERVVVGFLLLCVHGIFWHLIVQHGRPFAELKLSVAKRGFGVDLLMVPLQEAR